MDDAYTIGVVLGCEHPRFDVRERSIAGGNKQWRKQCLVCGKIFGGPMKKVDSARAIDIEAAERAERIEREFWERRAREKNELERKFWERYYAHLESPEWKFLRSKVLRRAQYTCEGCGASEAVEVHHTTYKHLGNEFLFELLALCRDCHTRYHDSNRGII